MGSWQEQPRLVVFGEEEVELALGRPVLESHLILYLIFKDFLTENIIVGPQEVPDTLFLAEMMLTH